MVSTFLICVNFFLNHSTVLRFSTSCYFIFQVFIPILYNSYLDFLGCQLIVFVDFFSVFRNHSSSLTFMLLILVYIKESNSFMFRLGLTYIHLGIIVKI